MIGQTSCTYASSVRLLDIRASDSMRADKQAKVALTNLYREHTLRVEFCLFDRFIHLILSQHIVHGINPALPFSDKPDTYFGWKPDSLN